MPVSPKLHPDKAAARIEKLLREGASINTIAQAAGLHTTTVHRIRTGNLDLIDRETHRKIMDARPKVGATVEIAGTRRRLQAIAALGYSLNEAAEATGLSGPLVTSIRTGKSATTSPDRAKSVTEFYEIIKDTPAPASDASRRAMAFAKRYRWAPPAAWEGRDIDDPNVGPGEYDGDEKQ
jgi:hypothetical protein